MKSLIYTITLFFTAFIFSGCATTQSISTDVRTETFKADYNQTFRAVVQTLSDDGYAVNTADSETGVINTDYSNASTLQAIFTGDRRTKVNAILNDTSNGTQVRLTVSVQKKGAFTGWQSASMTKSQAKQYYEELFNKIAKQLST